MIARPNPGIGFFTALRSPSSGEMFETCFRAEKTTISNQYKTRLENGVSALLSVTSAISNRYKTAVLQFAFFGSFWPGFRP
jgi:hypothetical protein